MSAAQNWNIVALGISVLSILCLLTTTSQSQETSAKGFFAVERTAQQIATTKQSKIPFEFQLSTYYTLPSTLNQGDLRLGRYAERTVQLTCATTMLSPLGFGLQLGIGGLWQHLCSPATVLPSDLCSAYVIIGILTQPSANWRLVLQARPGIYFDIRDVSWKAFNTPALLGAEYQVNENLKFLVGLSYDAQRQFPILPGVGVRWRLAERWTIELIAPRSRLIYQISEKITANLFAEFRSQNFRVAEDFGTIRKNRRLDGAWLDIREFHVGTAAELNIFQNTITAFAETGVTLTRTLAFQNAGLQYNTEPAPFIRTGCRWKF